MQLPFFYEPEILQSDNLLLSEENSKYLSVVLRIREGEQIHLTNGEGLLATGIVAKADKKQAEIAIRDITKRECPSPTVTIAISPVKNPQRFEWFIEKACELGTFEIIPLICQRTEKHFHKKERAEKIAVSAMLQSQQVFKTKMAKEVAFTNFVASADYDQKLIAHCLEGEKKNVLGLTKKHSVILIGPEGDFTQEEVQAALGHNFTSVSLGENRLRTETAGIAAAVLLNMIR